MSCVRGVLSHFKELTLNRKKEKRDYFSVLPNEILEKIFAHLRPKSLFENVLPVCRRFYYVVNNERWWKLRIEKNPLQRQLHDVEMFDSSPLRNWDAIWREEEAWSNWEKQKRHVSAPFGGSIEAVRLFRKSASGFCISAVKKNNSESRVADRFLQVHSLDNRKGKNGLLCETIGHTGIVSSVITGGTDQLISGSWDQSIKLWNIDNSSLREIASHRDETRIIQLAYENGLLASFSSVGTISLHDPYNGFQQLSRVTYRSSNGVLKGICTIVFEGTFLYLAFTRDLVVVDIRKINRPVLQHVYDQSFCCPDAFNITMNWSDGLLQCCNDRGDVQVREPSTLKQCYSFSVCNQDEYVKRRSNILVRNRGSLLLQTGKLLKAFSLRQGHAHLGTFTQFPDREYPTAMDARDGNVVVGCSRGSLITWTNDD